VTEEQSASNSPLGNDTVYPAGYDPKLLHLISRKSTRKALNIEKELPFHGEDIWTAYELSWLNQKGKPQVAIAEFIFPFDSANIVESKSFKLYLNSLNDKAFETEAELVKTLITDLSQAVGATVKVQLSSAELKPEKPAQKTQYKSLDTIDIAVTHYTYNPDFLKVKQGKEVSEKLVSHLFKSSCPVTAQPDWASVYIDYTGALIQHDALLKYLISYRTSAEYHEQCAERIFMDIWKMCRPEELTVRMRFLRRGGIDINPVRTNQLLYDLIPRVHRQ
jgi:7-cyano-7-deazaguanine reductase